jgi:hypothetical protein
MLIKYVVVRHFFCLKIPHYPEAEGGLSFALDWYRQKARNWYLPAGHWSLPAGPARSLLAK